MSLLLKGTCATQTLPSRTSFLGGHSRDRNATRVCHTNSSASSSKPEPTRRDILQRTSLITVAALSGAGPVVNADSAAEIPSTIPMPATEIDARGVERLALRPEGWSTWPWNNNGTQHNINYVSAGDSGPAVLLIHGFGASVYHWRYLIPELAKNHRVFAIDCLGFGWSDKALVDYEGYSVWTDQIADFIREIITPAAGKPILVGNSLGGYNSLAAAANHPELVRAVVLLNAAGRFEAGTGDETAAPAADAASKAAESPLRKVGATVGSAVKRAVIAASFIFTKQPARVRQVLKQVYYDDTNIDDDLVKSILLPAQDAKAAEVFYRVITASGTPVNKLLDRMNSMPVFLLWGSEDPWCVPARATQIQEHYSAADRVDIKSGHCPHDDTPAVVASELIKWIGALKA